MLHGEPEFDTTMAVLRDDSFAAAARDSIRDYLSRSELAQRPLPEGLTQQQLWKLISTMRRLGASYFPIRTATGEQFWYTITMEGRHCLRTIERHCRSDSRLHQMVRRRAGQRFLVGSRIREAIATCQADGLLADVTVLKRMLNEGRAPRTADSHLVKNTYNLLGELESLAAEEFSPDLLRHLYERTVQGVDLDNLTRASSRVTGVPPVFRTMLEVLGVPDFGAERSLQQICDYANGTTGDPRETVAVRGAMLQASMSYWRPLPDFNAIVARHMLGILAVKSGFPTLSYLPLCDISCRWAAGQPDVSGIRYSSIEPSAPGEDLDGTAEILVYLQLTVAAIEELLGRIQASKEDDEALSEALRDVGRFNYRQRELLTQALRRPTAEFTLREHRMSYQTVYSTARADLLELTTMGYLEKQTRGQSFIFVPVADLRERLGRERVGAE